MNVVDDMKREACLVNKELDDFFVNFLERDSFGAVLGKIKWDLDLDASFNSITCPIKDLLGRGGKRWRPYLMRLAYLASGGKGDIKRFLLIPELIHNGTLMIDDIEDSSDIRRGLPAIHKIYGEDVAINAGNALYYLPLVLLLKDKSISNDIKIRLYEAVNEEMIKISFGQGNDIYWHKNGSLPSENEYLQMCAFKTGTLARLAVRMGCVFAEASCEVTVAFEGFAEALGVAFQIQDDILNLSSKLQKTYGDDITEGKKTLLVIEALKDMDEEGRKDLLGILSLKTRNVVLIGEAIRLIEESSPFDYVRDVARNLVSESWERLSPLLKENEFKEKIKSLADYVICREI